MSIEITRCVGSSNGTRFWNVTDDDAMPCDEHDDRAVALVAGDVEDRGRTSEQRTRPVGQPPHPLIIRVLLRRLEA